MKAANYGCFFIVLSLLNPNRKTAQADCSSSRQEPEPFRQKTKTPSQSRGKNSREIIFKQTYATHSKKQSEIDVIFQNYRNL
jgi:hypothetical protein